MCDPSVAVLVIPLDACIAVPTIVAARTRAAEAFFGAIDLAGAYPVALLWGLAPPLMTLRMRSRQRRRVQGQPPKLEPTDHNAKLVKSSPPRLPSALLASLATLSIAFMATNLATDVAALLSPAHRARWQ